MPVSSGLVNKSLGCCDYNNTNFACCCYPPIYIVVVVYVWHSRHVPQEFDANVRRVDREGY